MSESFDRYSITASAADSDRDHAASRPSPARPSRPCRSRARAVAASSYARVQGHTARLYFERPLPVARRHSLTRDFAISPSESIMSRNAKSSLSPRRLPANREMGVLTSRALRPESWNIATDQPAESGCARLGWVSALSSSRSRHRRTAQTPRPDPWPCRVVEGYSCERDPMRMTSCCTYLRLALNPETKRILCAARYCV